jgi:SPP1 gp7 family putative phage head morphogenesis protein
MAIPNAEYWARRMEIAHLALEDRGLAYVRNLEAQFDRAIAQVEKDIAVWYQRFADNNAISYAEARKWLTAGELKEFRWTVEDYIRHGEENALDGRWMRELENASARVHISRLDALKLEIQQQAELLHGGQLDGLDALMRRTYTEGYYTTAYELQRGIGTGWTLHGLNEGTVSRVLTRPWTEDGQTFTDRVWTNKRALVNSVNTHLTQMIVRGESPARAIAAVTHDMGVAKNKAARLVMTESAYFSSAAQADCYKGLGVEHYVIVATLDSQTSEICRDLDGDLFKMSEYTVGATAPPFHPWCRTCTAPWFEDMAGLGERAIRDPDTNKTVVDIPRGMKYRDWEKQFVQPDPAPVSAGLPTAPKNDIIKGTARTMAEAARQSQQYAGAAAYRGVKNLDSVNELNGTLDYLGQTYHGKPLAEIKTSTGSDAWASANYRGLYPRAHFLNDPAGAVASSTTDWVATNAARFAEYTKAVEAARQEIASAGTASARRTWEKIMQARQETLDRIIERMKYARHNVVYAGHEVRSVFTHEYGHVLADQVFGQINGARANPAFAYNTNNVLYQRVQLVKNTFDKAVADGDIFSISMYAAKDAHEFLAEVFTMYDMGMETLPAYIVDMIEEVFDL